VNRQLDLHTALSVSLEALRADGFLPPLVGLGVRAHSMGLKVLDLHTALSGSMETLRGSTPVASGETTPIWGLE